MYGIRAPAACVRTWAGLGLELGLGLSPAVRTWAACSVGEVVVGVVVGVVVVVVVLAPYLRLSQAVRTAYMYTHI